MVLLYDGSYEGMLSALYYAFKGRVSKAEIRRSDDFQPDLFQESLEIESDREYALSVMGGIKTRLGGQALSDVMHAFLSEEPGLENTVLEYLRYGFKERRDITDDLAVPSVLKITDLASRVRREAHKITGFLRFQKLKDGTYYSEIGPDNNVLPLFGNHFKDRFADQNWIIQDARRNTALVYRDGELEAVSFLCLNQDQPIDTILAPDESMYTELWTKYCHDIAIPERKNKKLQMQFMPKKYWQFLTEMKS